MTTTYANYEWFLEQDFSQYSGKWLAIIDKEIVAIGDHIKEVISQVKDKYPNKKPFVTKINTKQSIFKF